MRRVLTLALFLLSCAPGGAAPSDPLAPGDRLQIRVAGEADLSKEYMIDESGQIRMDLIGTIKAAGLTEKEFQATLHRRLSKYLRKPDITLHAFQKIAVGGGVRQPGGYDFPKDQPVRLMDALTKAGGFAERAKKRRVLVVKRATSIGSGTPQTLLIDINAYLKKGKPENNPLLGPNDVVYVDQDDPRESSRGFAGLLERALPLVGAFL